MFGPGSAAWRIGGERLVTVVGGGRALLMQIAHPLVAAGVADHSDFEADPFARLWRTIGVVLDVVFGDHDQAAAAAERVNRIHAEVVGERDGSPYRALEPELLLWVHATLVDTALVTYARFVRPVAPAEGDRYYQEMKRSAALFRVPDDILPPDLPAFRRYLRTEISRLRVGEEARRLAGGILDPPLPWPLAPAGSLLRQATIGLLPARLRSAFGFCWTENRERVLRASAWIIRRTLPLLPANIVRWPHVRASQARSELSERE